MDKIPNKLNLRLDRRPPEFFASMPSAETAVICALLDGNRDPRRASEVVAMVEEMCLELHFTGDTEYPVTAAGRLIRAFFPVEEARLFQRFELLYLADYIATCPEKNSILLVKGRYIYWSSRQGCYESFENLDTKAISALWQFEDTRKEGAL